MNHSLPCPIRLHELSEETIETLNHLCLDGLMNPQYLQSELPMVKIIDFINIDSTNKFLKMMPPQQTPILCYSESQTMGRGRLGRYWNSPFGQNLYFSLSWAFNCDIQKLQGLSLCVGLALAQALEDYTGLFSFQVKWPNDIVVDSHKLAGILIEISASSAHQTQVIIGIGLNVNSNPKDMQFIERAWSSLQQITQYPHLRQKILIVIIQKLTKYLKQFEQHGWSSFMEAWRLKDALYYKKVKIQQHELQLEGIAIGVDEQGRLILQDNLYTRLVDVGDATLSI